MLPELEFGLALSKFALNDLSGAEAGLKSALDGANRNGDIGFAWRARIEAVDFRLRTGRAAGETLADLTASLASGGGSNARLPFSFLASLGRALLLDGQAGPAFERLSAALALRSAKTSFGVSLRNSLRLARVAMIVSRSASPSRI